MSRNSKSHQHSSNSHANELLNFRFSTPVVDRQESASSRSRNHNYSQSNRRGNNFSSNRQNQNYGRRNSSNNNRRSAQDRADARRKADSSMFYLHSSGEHSFFLTRRSPSKVHKEQYVFNGVDEGVSWDAVRMVEQRVSCSVQGKASFVVDDSDGPSCPICLCDFVCARITKCGHSFCLPCILRHVQTYTASNPYQHVKCPCCGIPIVVDDLRPVAFEMVIPPLVQAKFRLRKLYRQKQAAAPFLPLPDAPMHGNPHFCPTAKVDADAKYSRFNFVDSQYYHSTLVENQMEIQHEISSSPDHAEKIHLCMALEIVLMQQQHAQQEHEEEETLRERYANPYAGMYQPQSPALVFSHASSDATRASEQMSALAEEWRPPATAENFVTQASPASPPVGRYRGDSVGSYVSVESAVTQTSIQTEEGSLPTSPGGSSHGNKPKARHQGTMYLDESNALHFYQSEDGQLVFLNGFNMACLLSDYAKGLSDTETGEDGAVNEDKKEHTVQQPPLPDFIEGKVIEIENVQLTPELRKRLSFLSHIPHYTDIIFVELDLNHVLSEDTRRKFKNDIAKRRKRRQAKIQAEKRADKAALREEMERINERKARLQIIDPNDEFFQIPSMLPDPRLAEGEEFGPALGAENDATASSTRRSAAPSQDGSAINFSAAARRGADPISISSTEAFPALGAAAEAFPALGSPSLRSLPVVKPIASAAGSTTTIPSIGGGGKKKKKGQKILLFSTGGGRAY